MFTYSAIGKFGVIRVNCRSMRASRMKGSSNIDMSFDSIIFVSAHHFQTLSQRPQVTIII